MIYWPTGERRRNGERKRHRGARLAFHSPCWGTDGWMDGSMSKQRLGRPPNDSVVSLGRPVNKPGHRFRPSPIQHHISSPVVLVISCGTAYRINARTPQPSTNKSPAGPPLLRRISLSRTGASQTGQINGRLMNIAELAT